MLETERENRPRTIIYNNTSHFTRLTPMHEKHDGKGELILFPSPLLSKTLRGLAPGRRALQKAPCIPRRETSCLELVFLSPKREKQSKRCQPLLSQGYMGVLARRGLLHRFFQENRCSSSFPHSDMPLNISQE